VKSVSLPLLQIFLSIQTHHNLFTRQTTFHLPAIRATGPCVTKLLHFFRKATLPSLNPHLKPTCLAFRQQSSLFVFSHSLVVVFDLLSLPFLL